MVAKVAAFKVYFAVSLIHNMKIDARNEAKEKALQLVQKPSPELILKLKSAAAAAEKIQMILAADSIEREENSPDEDDLQRLAEGKVMTDPDWEKEEFDRRLNEKSESKRWFER